MLRTGDEYLASLRDGRRIYIGGESGDGRHHSSGIPQHRTIIRANI